MRALLAIAARELGERWTLPLAVFCFGFVPLVLALRAGERALEISLVLAVPTAWTTALILGGSVIARDYGDGRLGFFFARPVPWWAIGGGKLLAALVLTLLTAIAAALPSVLAEGGLSAAALGQAMTSGRLALFLALVVGVLALGHAASVVYRSRSAWAALDVVLFAGAVLLALTLVRAFARIEVVTLGGLWRAAFVLSLAALVPLSAAAAQLAFGRSDPRRGHRALSFTFWGGTLACFAVAGALLARELTATPLDFARRFVLRATSDGRFLWLMGADSGPRSTRTASFLVDSASGRALRIPSAVEPAFSADSRHAAWLEEAPFWRRHGADLDLVLARLDGPLPLVETLELDPPLPRGGLRELVLDASGARAAAVQPFTLSVHELPSGRSLSRTSAADGEWVAAAFLADGRLRALRRLRAVVGGPGRDVIPGFLELVDLAGGIASSRLPLEAVGHATLASGLGGDFILLYEPKLPRAVSLHDARSGRRLRTFAGEDAFMLTDALLLGNGSGVVVVETGPSASRLRVAVDGEPDRLIELPGPGATLGGELPGGRVSVSLRGAVPRPALDPEPVSLVVSLASGAIERREEGLEPALRQGVMGGGRRAPGASTLFTASTGEIVRLDPDTGARQVVLAAKPAR